MKHILQQSPQFWQSMLGSKLYAKLINNPEQIMTPSVVSNEQETKIFLNNLQNQNNGSVPKEYDFLNEEVFAPLYKQIIYTYLCSNEHESIIDTVLENPLQMLKIALYNSIKEIPTRVCIYDMQLCKKNNQLSGDDPSSEYFSYCNEKLSNGTYIWKLCCDYPEMTRLLYTRLANTEHFITEIARHVYENKEEIVSRLCDGKDFISISVLEIKGSDCHNGSRKTVKCVLDNGVSIIYKPHGMEKEIEYQRLYNLFSSEMSLDNLDYPIIDGRDYGIAKCLDTRGCTEKVEVERYFKRMGVHLFLCYLLHANDMHHENILASQEYPVLVDAETILGIQKQPEPQNAEDIINEQLSWTVLKTGILPIPVWRADDRGVILSALHNGGEVYTTVKLPVIKEAKTSNMYINYDYIKIDNKGSLPDFNGNEVNPAEYTKELCEGFSNAYKYYLNDKQQIEQILIRLKELDTRHLIRHTQQYFMYLSSSTHPIFLKDTKARLLMLQVLQKNDYNMDFIKEEISALMDMDTPLLTCRGGDYVPFYGCSAYDTHMHLVKKMCDNDLEAQLKLIKVSMELIDFSQLKIKYFTYSRFKAAPNKRSGDEFKSAIKLLIKQLEDSAVIYQNDICWSTIKFEGNNLWNFEPLKMDLYEGIYGMAVFFALADKYNYLSNSKIYDLTLESLCRYANMLSTSDKSDETYTGLFVGTGSLIYTFILLYKIRGNEQFLEYAKKQISHLEKIYTDDKDFDLFSGNAGAIIALLKLYEETADAAALDLAVKIGEHLWSNAIKQGTGYGWNVRDNNTPLSGMSHGNSGFIMAYAYLLEYTHDDKYCKIIDELIAYENTLYSDKEKNWRDLRGESGNHGVYANSWCHGAAGILLSRMKLAELDEYKDNETVKTDIKNAADTLFEKSKRKGLCLCHGMSGNYMIMKLYKKAYDLTDSQRKNMEYLKDSIIGTILDKKMLLQDKYFTGLMTGTAGIALCLLDMLDEE